MLIFMNIEMGSRIRLAMVAAGLNQTTLAEAMGVTPQAVQKWVTTGSAGPKGSRLSKLASVLNVSVDWLVTENKNYHSINNAQRRSATEDRRKNSNLNTLGESNVKKFKGNVVLVPLISWVQAGAWCEAHEPYPPGYAEEWVPVSENCSANTFALRVQGDSMTSPHSGQRSYPEGITIVVDPDREVTNGCRVIAKLLDSNEATFKEYREDGGKKYLKPLNPQYQMQELAEGSAICGVVIYAGWKE